MFVFFIVTVWRGVFFAMLQNMLNHYSAYEFDSFKLKLVVVVHGAGLKFFLDDRAARRGRTTTSIRSSTSASPASPSTGSRGYLCQITYKRLNIDPAKTRKDSFLKFVPSGVATVAELQTKGFAYLKVG